LSSSSLLLLLLLSSSSSLLFFAFAPDHCISLTGVAALLRSVSRSPRTALG
jgi:hypothetical protein